MKRKVLAALLAGVMVFSLTACGDKKDEKKDDTAKNGKTELEDSLVIYSTHSEEMLETICDAFTEETGVEVEFINLKGELADRVRSEKENPQADIMFGGDTATYMLLQDAMSRQHRHGRTSLQMIIKMQKDIGMEHIKLRLLCSTTKS